MTVTQYCSTRCLSYGLLSIPELSKDEALADLLVSITYDLELEHPLTNLKRIQ